MIPIGGMKIKHHRHHIPSIDLFNRNNNNNTVFEMNNNFVVAIGNDNEFIRECNKWCYLRTTA